MDYGQQFESLYPMHNLSKSSNEMSSEHHLSWQKYGEIFLTRDLMSMYVCSGCDAETAKEPSKIMDRVNAKHFVTSEVRKFWLHVQQCHVDKCSMASFRKLECLKSATEKLMVQNVIVIEDDDDDYDDDDEAKLLGNKLLTQKELEKQPNANNADKAELLGTKLLTELELKKQQRAVSANNETTKQNHKQQKETEDSGSILVSLLTSKPNNLNKPAESPKNAEDIFMDYLAEDDIMSKQFSNIENQLREMHGDVNERESPLDPAFQVGVPSISKQSLEDELKTKLLDGIYAESKRKDLDDSIDENNVDLNVVLESEDISIAMNGDDCDTFDCFYKNGNTMTDSTITNTMDFSCIVKERSEHLEEYLSKNSNNHSNNKHNENDSEIIELSDCDEEEVVKDGSKAVNERDITAQTVPIDSQIQSVKDISNNNCENNNNNNYPICPPLCGKQFEDNLKVMEHSEHRQKHTQQSSQTHNQIIPQMCSHTFQEQPQQNFQINNPNNQSNNQTNPNMSLPSPLYEHLKCNYCEQTFSAFWQKWRHETLHFKRRKNTAYNDAETPTKKITQYCLRPFKCPTCGRRTNTTKNMLKHMQSYHPDVNVFEPINIQPQTENSHKTFQCQHCSSYYRSKQSLTAHIKRIHVNLLTSSDAASNAISDAVPETVPATVFAPYDSPFTTPLEANLSNTLSQQQTDEKMNYHCRWHMESSNQTAWLADSSQDSMESIGTLLPAGCELET